MSELSRCNLKHALRIGALLLLAAGTAGAMGKSQCGGIIHCASDLDCPTTFGPVPFHCVDDPRDGCDPQAGDTGCLSVCAQPIPDNCGGILQTPCPFGMSCQFEAVRTDVCIPDCFCSDALGKCTLFPDQRLRGCKGKDKLSCRDGQTCMDIGGDLCHPECGGEGCANACGVIRPDTCALGDPASCPDEMLCVHFRDFSPYFTPPGGKTACANLPQADCRDDADCPLGFVCGDYPGDACEPAGKGKPCLTCCVQAD